MRTRAGKVLLAPAASCLSAATFWMMLPLIALALRARGVNDAYVGIISGMPWAGLLAVSLIIPRLIRRFGPQRLMLGGMALAILIFLGFACTGNVWLWTMLCVLLGASWGVRWAAMDTWVSAVVPEHLRGRLIGIFELAQSASISLGPALLILTGTAGVLPFFAGIAILLAAMALLAVARRERGFTVHEEHSGLRMREILVLGAPIFIGALLMGVTEASDLSLLPVFGLSSGTSAHVAALLVVVIQAGVALGAMAFGLFADHVNRRAMHIAAAAGIALLPLAAPGSLNTQLIWPVLVAWGAAQGGLYTMGVVMLGARFKGSALVRAMPAVLVTYTLGGIAGPPLMGTAMALLGPDGLIAGTCAAGVLGTVAIYLTGRPVRSLRRVSV